MLDGNDPLLTEPIQPNWYPPWSPRIWNGMQLPAYLRLLAESRFRIHPARYPMTGLIGCCTIVNSILAPFQSLLFGRKIRNVELPADPIFIIGHWRSGTTLLHELMGLDPRLAYASTFDTFVPHHLLVSRWLFKPLIGLLLPPERPMDSMKMGVNKPQEDDFALCTLGAPSPYRRLAFPNSAESQPDQLDANRLTAEQQADLRRAMLDYVRTLTLHYRRPLVLKSPPHTGRIRLLKECFPSARFIHLSRHPHELVPSTMKLWRSLDSVQGFQFPKYDNAWLLQYVEQNQRTMYQAYLRDRTELPDSQLIEISYEQLNQQPLAVLQTIYNRFGLGDFAAVQPRIERSLAKRSGYRRSEYTLTPGMKAHIDEQWAEYMEQFGYAKAPTSHPQSAIG